MLRLRRGIGKELPMHEKVFVQVLVLFNEEGTMMPKSIRWEDGRVFPIDRVLDIRPSARL